MDKLLNQEALSARCVERGFSQAAIAKQMGLTRAAVSKWFNGQSFPRPAELLKLGRLLGLPHKELVLVSDAAPEPLVAFRKRKGCKTTARHVARAKDMGHWLRPIVPYLNFDPFVGPPSLKNPSTDYRYLQDLVAKLRREIDVAEDAPVEFSKLIEIFHKYQAVIVPVLWGKQSQHENALHIHLPDSKTTWIYLNLDVEIHDFKFWMVHELGHVLTIDLLESDQLERAEDFAEAFAGAFLFPEPLAREAFHSYSRMRSDRSRMTLIMQHAEEHTISPFSVYKEIEAYASARNLPFVEIDRKLLHQAITQFNKEFASLAEHFFDGEHPSADHFMRVTEQQFGTEFFKAFAAYVEEKRPSASVIGSILEVNPMDARAYHDALTQ
jgi:transcriptional regulator with XRE-family HTH domain/Zn-dependent peptidase ImmA (M78 family)